jgi:hypothetical protein
MNGNWLRRVTAASVKARFRDHPPTVSFDVSAAHGAVRFETGEKPQHGQNSEAQMCGETVFRYQSHGEAGD